MSIKSDSKPNKKHTDYKLSERSQSNKSVFEK